MPRYAVNTGTTGGATHVLWINDQPAVVLCVPQDTVFMADVTQYVVDGTNSVRVTSAEDPNANRVEIALSRWYEDDTNAEPIATLTAGGAEPNIATCTFEATVPVRWTWQDAEDLADLSPDDEAAILLGLQAFADLAAKGDFAACRRHQHPWLSADPPRGLLAENRIWQMKELAERERQFIKGLTQATVCPREEVDFYAGTRVVRLRSKARETGLMHLKGTGSPPELVVPHACFIRLKGKWRYLDASWGLRAIRP